MDVRGILERLGGGEISVDQAEAELRNSGVTDMGFAHLDSGRKERTGFAEVVYCAGKSDGYLCEIYKKLFETEGRVFGTRASLKQAQAVKAVLPEVQYDDVSRILWCGDSVTGETGGGGEGNIAVCTAGTSDIPVAEEAAHTAEYFGSYVERIYDVGVSGLHRLLSQSDKLGKANVVVVAAGMEGALASVVGGLVSVPVIAVPTSVGYGASFGGLAALLTMLNSCSNGVSVVNIDNGFGAGYIATQINRLALGKPLGKSRGFPID